MSLLINESYANTAQPLWAGANGGTISGNLTVNGNITTTPVGLSSITTGGLFIKDPGNTTRLAMGYTGANGQILCNPGNAIVLTQSGSTGNTTFTPSAQGANLDALVVGGVVSTRQLKMLDTGVAAVAGSDTLTAGQVVVNTNACLGPSSYILLTRTGVNASTALGELRVQTKNVGNFIVDSCSVAAPPATEVNDVSSFDWVIINPV